MKSYILLTTLITSALAIPVLDQSTDTDSARPLNFFAEYSDGSSGLRPLAAASDSLSGDQDLPIIVNAASDMTNAIEGHIQRGDHGDDLYITKPAQSGKPANVLLHNDKLGSKLEATLSISTKSASDSFSLRLDDSQGTYLAYKTGAPGFPDARFFVCNRDLQGYQKVDQLVVDLSDGQDAAITDCVEVNVRALYAVS